MATIEYWPLRRAGAAPEPPPASAEAPRAPVARGKALIMMGNSGESVGMGTVAHTLRDGYHLVALSVNNDRHGPPPPEVRLPGGEVARAGPQERLVLGAEGNARDQIKEYPLLVERYLERGLLQNLSVFDTYPRAGRGGHGFPVISAMDVDLEIERLYSFLRRGLRRLAGDDEGPPNHHRLQQLAQEWAERRLAASIAWTIVMIGGGAGSCGNACHQLLPYLVRHMLAEPGVRNYELWGVILGPAAFTGLTPDITNNYLALLHSLDHMARHGQRRRYINGLEIDSAAPPYDKVFLIDDPTLPGDGGVVTEAELERFFDRAALAIHLLLSTEAYGVVASHTANPRAGAVADGSGPRWLNSVSGEMAAADRAGLRELLASAIEARLLEALVARLGA